MSIVNVIELEPSNESSPHGSLVKVTLERDCDTATCDGILIWEDPNGEDDGTFDEWVECAKNGVEGYTCTITENGVTTTHGSL